VLQGNDLIICDIIIYNSVVINNLGTNLHLSIYLLGR
jgi:hypothetical protein